MSKLTAMDKDDKERSDREGLTGSVPSRLINKVVGVPEVDV